MAYFQELLCQFVLPVWFRRSHSHACGWSLNLDLIPALVDHFVRDRVSALFVCGTTGEWCSLTTEERKEVADAYAGAARGRYRSSSMSDIMPCGIAFAGCACAQDWRGCHRHYSSIISQAVNRRNVVDCLEEITGAVPDMPCYYYHIPSLSGVNLPLIEILRQAEHRLPSLCGFKYTFENIMDFRLCLEFSGGRYNGLFGREEMLLSALAIGATGAVGSTYIFAAPLYQRIWNAWNTGDIPAAQASQQHAIEMMEILIRYRGLPGMKAAMAFIGLDCGPCRLPLQTLSTDELTDMETELREIGFFKWGREV